MTCSLTELVHLRVPIASSAMSENQPETTPSDPPPPTIPVDLTWEALKGRNSIEPAKKTWLELVGLPAEEAEKKIKEELEGVSTYVVPENSFVTMDFRTDRVRLYVDAAGNVARAPRIG